MKILEFAMKKSMKVRRTSLVAMMVLTAMVSLACSLFTIGMEATPTREPEPNFKPVTTPLVIKPASLPNARLGLMYEAKLQITQNVTPVGDMVIKGGALPAGLEFVFMNGEDAAIIRGTPEETGSFTFAVFAWCFGTQVSGQTLEKEYQIVVDE